MRICYIADAPIPSTGANCVQMMHMNAALAAAGHEVVLLGRRHARQARDPAARRAMCQEFGVSANFSLRYLPFLRLGRRLRASYFWVAALWARALGSDLVITRTARIADVCVRLGRRVLLELHTPPGSPAGWRALRRLAAEPNLVRWVFISDRLRQLVSHEVALPDSKVIVAHDAVDLARFRPVQTCAEARARLGAPAGPLVVYAGSLFEGRGGEELVDVAAQLPHVRFWLVGGEPNDVARIRARAERLGVRNVQLHGRVAPSQLATYLFAADLLVIPTTLEGRAVDRRTVHVDYSSPMKLFEYLAAGRPIVATRLSGLTEVVQHEREALLVEPGSVSELRSGIERLLADSELSERLARAAALASSKFTWEQRARDMLADLETIAGSETIHV